MIAALASLLFILIWSTGFIVARAMVPHAAPELILALRLTLTTLLLAGAALCARQALPRGRRLTLHLAAGAMLHGFYLTLSWWAVNNGMPAGVMALLGALQPLMVAVASVAFLGDRLPPRAWTGLAIAILGVGCVLLPAIGRAGAGSITIWPAFAGMVAVLGMAGGTLIQRGAIAGDGIAISGAVQNAGGALVALMAALIVGEYRWDGNPILWLGLGWSVLGLSAGGLSLLVWLVRHQGPTRMSMLLLLVPPLAAIEAWLLFGERLGPVQLIGFALALGGVMLGRSTRPARGQEITEPA
ncbi:MULTISPECIES: DMT family transporter [unclassified Sphingobium]|uniref:DMT family transporter n=1 Tax=unclassified Sphingobium TaxID=2611147 RepID=UPI00077027CE|nr:MULTISPECIES: DMT family transporter [Sphingomonadaceae]AMK24227.1 putative permease [Sphingobium sp. TKS]NML90304.1 DMT family transporter [Sphingobium sp. TB-6]